MAFQAGNRDVTRNVSDNTPHVNTAPTPSSNRVPLTRTPPTHSAEKARCHPVHERAAQLGCFKWTVADIHLA